MNADNEPDPARDRFAARKVFHIDKLRRIQNKTSCSEMDA